MDEKTEGGGGGIAGRALAAAVGSLLLAGCSSPEVSVELIEDRRIADSPQLIRLLAEGSPEDRARAALAMGRIQDRSYVGPLVEATRDAETPVRAAALFALGQLGLVEGAGAPETAVQACDDVLKDEDPEIVALAIEALGKLADADLPQRITPHLGHESSRVREETALALFRSRYVPLWRKQVEEPPPLPASATAGLIAAMSDGEVRVRRAGAYAFSRWGEPEALPALLKHVDDPDEWVRLFAIRAIGRSEDSGVIDALALGLSDPSAHVRAETVIAFGRLGLAERLPAEIATDASFHVRAQLAHALSEAKTAASLETLRALEADESPTVTAAAIDSLARRTGAEYAVSLGRHLDSEAWPVAAAAARAAGELGASGLPVIDRALVHADNRVRAAGVAALEKLEGVDERIADALSVPDLAIRGTAVSLWADREHERKLAWLTQAYENSAGDEWTEVREGVVDAIAGDDAAVELLGRIAAEDPAASVRSKAKLALQERGVELSAEPPPTIEPSSLLSKRFLSDPVVVFETSKGVIEMRCLTREAPIHVAGFIERVREGFYDDLVWHRVVSNFVIQGGDPRGDGWGSGGFTVRDEINTARYDRGAVGMPKAGKDTGGCQVFITHVPTPHLDGNYTVFATVTAGLETVDQIEVGDRINRAFVKP